jgi:SAM-dependent MidA family methyltransferase
VTATQRGITPVAVLLAEQIRDRGPITFADYMEACLYHPQYGYYTKAAQGAKRDYFTNADVSPLFGRLLARQFEEMWTILGHPDPLYLVEAGAGSGALAKAALDFVEEGFPGFYAALRYIAVEKSETRRAAAAPLLEKHILRGHCELAAVLPGEIREGCIFSNELLDALPVHLVVQDRGQLQELYVAAHDGQFRLEAGPPSSKRLPDYFARQGIALGEGQQAEVCLAACDWIRDAGSRLPRGFVMTIDYGREARELYDERHMRGTLLAYQNHLASEECFRAPGDQDLTAHVNFTALDVWGAETALARVGLTTQSNFLLALARKSNFADIDATGFAESEKGRQRLLFKTLINPEGMGEAFQVLIQQKGLNGPAPALAGLQPL